METADKACFEIISHTVPQNCIHTEIKLFHEE